MLHDLDQTLREIEELFTEQANDEDIIATMILPDEEDLEAEVQELYEINVNIIKFLFQMLMLIRKLAKYGFFQCR